MQSIHEEASVRGRVFDIQRMAIQDGPGIRTTVFLKGCGLRCLWCHNPEGIDPVPQLAFTPSLCIGCGQCLRRCPQGAHVTVDGSHQLERARCQRCFLCVKECCSRALESVGEEMTVEAVLAEVVRDRAFYEESGGGITVSGGEPLAQFKFTRSLLRGAREQGLHTCLETCGFGAPGDVTGLVPLVDLFLFDIKETDPERHRAYTGHSNFGILDTLRRLDAAGASIVLRCLVIPGVNLRDSHLEGIAAIQDSLRHCRGINLMGYHFLGEGKRQRLGDLRGGHPDNTFAEMSRDELEAVADHLRGLGCDEVTVV